MVTDPRGQRRRPCVNVNVLELDLSPLDSRRDQRVVELLRVLVEDIAVSLVLGDLGGLVDVGEQAGEGLVDRAGLDELVEVAGDDDVGKTALVEHSLDEALSSRRRELGRVDFHKEFSQILTATLATWPVLFSMGEFTGGRASPWVELLPPLELK